MKSPCRLMLVSDESLVIESLGFLLKKLSDQIDIFANSKEALSRAKAQRYNLVISDYVIPEIGGIELVKTIRKTEPETRSIILCGYAHLSAVLRAVKNAEISNYISKPWKDEALIKTVSEVLNKNNKVSPFPCTAKKTTKKAVLKGCEKEGALAKLERKFPGITQGAWEANKPFV